MNRNNKTQCPFFHHELVVVASAMLFASGATLDTVTTYLFIGHPAFLESNEVVAAAVAQYGLVGLVGAKTIALLICVVGGYISTQDLKSSFVIAMAASGLVWLAAGLWNMRLIVLTV